MVGIAHLSLQNTKIFAILFIICHQTLVLDCAKMRIAYFEVVLTDMLLLKSCNGPRLREPL
jgi:hypothetical protein